MTMSCKTFRFLILIGLWKGIINTDLGAFFMNRNCDGTLELALERTYSAAISFDQWVQVSADKCDYTIQAYTSQDSLMFYFESFAVDCEDGHLEIAHSTDQNFLNSESIRGLNGSICGNKPKDIYVASARFLRLTFQPASASLVGRVSFKLILTIFQNGPCDSFDFTCDNGRCINKELKCNGYNPCGDDSDCPADLSSDGTSTTSEIVSSVVGLIFFAVFALCVFSMFRSHRSGRSPFHCLRECCECIGELFSRIGECCSNGCSRVGDCCECTAEIARRTCHACHECGSSARTKCCTICVRTTESTDSESSDRGSQLPQTVSTEIQTDNGIQTESTDTDQWANIASAPTLATDDTGPPPSYEAATAMNPKQEAAPPSYDKAMEMVKY